MKIKRNPNFMRSLENNINKMLYKKAITTQNEVKKELSKNESPSSPGEAPGVVTGHLRRSITYKKIGNYKYIVGTNVFYGRIHEFGGRFKSKYFPARPFLRPVYNKLRNNRI